MLPFSQAQATKETGFIEQRKTLAFVLKKSPLLSMAVSSDKAKWKRIAASPAGRSYQNITDFAYYFSKSRTFNNHPKGTLET